MGNSYFRLISPKRRTWDCPLAALAAPIWQDVAMSVRVFTAGNPPAELIDALKVARVKVVDDPAEATFLIWNSIKTKELAETLHPGIKWVQLPSAGVNLWLNTGVLDNERTWLSAAGAYSAAVASHAVAGYLAAIHRIPDFAAATTWQALQFRPLSLRRVAILGLGGIGAEIARQLQALGVAEVRGVVRNHREEPHADTVTTLTNPAWPEGIDDIINVLPATPATAGIIDAHVISHLPTDGIIVNVGRGEAIVDDDALAALANDRLGGMVLDVTDPEPLPDDHPYWRDDRVVITAHSANPTVVATPAFVERAMTNIQRASQGEPLLGVVDVEHGY